MIDVVSRNWNAVNWTEDTTCLRDPRRLYISNQLKTIKIALVQQLVGQSRRSLRLCSGLRVSFFFLSLTSLIYESTLGSIQSLCRENQQFPFESSVAPSFLFFSLEKLLRQLDSVLCSKRQTTLIRPINWYQSTERHQTNYRLALETEAIRRTSRGIHAFEIPGLVSLRFHTGRYSKRVARNYWTIIQGLRCVQRIAFPLSFVSLTWLIARMEIT